MLCNFNRNSFKSNSDSILCYATSTLEILISIKAEGSLLLVSSPAQEAPPQEFYFHNDFHLVIAMLLCCVSCLIILMLAGCSTLYCIVVALVVK